MRCWIWSLWCLQQSSCFIFAKNWTVFGINFVNEARQISPSSVSAVAMEWTSRVQISRKRNVERTIEESWRNVKESETKFETGDKISRRRSSEKVVKESAHHFQWATELNEPFSEFSQVEETRRWYEPSEDIIKVEVKTVESRLSSKMEAFEA